MISCKPIGYCPTRERNLVYTTVWDKGDPTKAKTRVCAKFVFVELQEQNVTIRVKTPKILSGFDEIINETNSIAHIKNQNDLSSLTTWKPPDGNTESFKRNIITIPFLTNIIRR